MTAHVNVSGTWKQITNMYTKVSGVWKEISSGDVNVSGTWKNFFSSAFGGQAADLSTTAKYTSRSGALSPALSSNLVGSFSFWYRSAGASAGAPFLSWSSGFGHSIAEINRYLFAYFQPTFYNSSGTTIAFCTSTTAIDADSNWHHICGSFNCSTSAWNFYRDGVDDLSSSYTDAASGNVDWGSLAEFRVGQEVLDMAEFWITNEFIDFSSSANREKFRSSSGYPVDLGSDGSTPTGTAPGIYLRLGPSDLIAAWATNRSGRGDFTNNGSPTIASTDPFP